MILSLGVWGCADATYSSGSSMVGVEVLGSSPSIYEGTMDDDETALGNVVALRVGRGESFELCTGALVAPNLVLTARHCVAKSVTTAIACDQYGRSANGEHVAEDLPTEDIGIYTGARPRFATAPNAHAIRIVAPAGPYLCDSDIAFILIDTSLRDVEPLAIRVDGPAREGELVRSVGYGQNNGVSPIGTRLRRDGVSVLAQGKIVSKSKTALGKHEFEVGRSICQGDSGGPAISEETGAVLGVVSRGSGCDTDYGHIYTTTAGWDDLVREAFEVAGATPIVEEGHAVLGANVRHNGEAPDDFALPQDESGGSCTVVRGVGLASQLPWFAIAVSLWAASRRRRAL